MSLLGKKNEKFSVYNNQDSSLQKILKESDGIWIRNPNEEKINKDTVCNVILFNSSFLEEI